MTTLTPTEILTLTLWGEARGEPIEGQIAVASVIKNRLADGRWGESIERVCLAPQQFSCWNAGPDPNHKALMALAGRIQMGEAITDPLVQQCAWIADGTVRAKFQDRVSGATHYFAQSLTAPPAWALQHDPVAIIGRHLFFKGIT